MGQRELRRTGCIVSETVCLRSTVVLPVVFDPKHSLVSGYHCLFCDRPSQPGATVLGVVFAPVQVARQCSCNIMNALANRHAVVQPEVQADFEPGDLDFVMFKRIVALYDFIKPQIEGSWLVYKGNELIRSKWPRSKALNIIRSLCRDQVRPDLVKSFIKREISKICLHGQGLLTKARLIQGYVNEATMAAFGVEFCAFQKALASLWSVDEPYELYPGIWVSMASGCDPRSIAAWADVMCYWWYERDGKCWDATMSRPHFMYKLACLKLIDPNLAGFAATSMKVRGFANGAKDADSVVYDLDCTVKSGQNDTTSGNSLINGVITARVFRDLGLSGRILVAGDDMLAAVLTDCDPSVIGSAIAARERQYGIVPEYGCFEHVEDTSFVSANFYNFGGKLYFLPSLGRQLAKLWYTVQKVHPKRVAAYRNGVAKCMLSIVGSAPVFSEFFSTGLSDGEAVLFDQADWWVWRPVDKPLLDGVSDVEILVGLASRYSCSVQVIREFREFLAGVPPGFIGLASHPTADLVMARDLADMPDRLGFITQRAERS